MSNTMLRTYSTQIVLLKVVDLDISFMLFWENKIDTMQVKKTGKLS
jgi:hypothetical protein